MLMKQTPVVGTQPTGRDGHKTAQHPRALHPGYFQQLRIMGGKTLEKAEGEGPCRVTGPLGRLKQQQEGWELLQPSGQRAGWGGEGGSH